MLRYADPMVALPFADALGVLMASCRVDPDGGEALDARVRQLQRLGLPGLPPSGGRVDYGLLELAELATAMRLMAAYMVPTLAARYVIERWDTLSGFALAGSVPSLPPSYLARRPVRPLTRLVIEGSALAELGRRGKHDGRYLGPLGDVAALEVGSVDAASVAMGGAVLVLDSSTYMPTLVAQFGERTAATTVELAYELDRIRFGRSAVKGRPDGE